MGSEEAIRAVVESGPDIISHNVETVRRLTPRVRSRSSYDRSLDFLRISRGLAPEMVTKSSIMLGLGESFEEVEVTLGDLRSCGVDVVNIGQYLQPTKNHIPVQRYWTPEEFGKLKDIAMGKGFLYCESGPFVRSSYHADTQFKGFQQHLEKLRAAKASAQPPVSS